MTGTGETPTTIPYGDALAHIDALLSHVRLLEAHVENLIERMHEMEQHAGLLDECEACGGSGVPWGGTTCQVCRGSGCNPVARWNRESDEQVVGP